MASIPISSVERRKDTTQAGGGSGSTLGSTRVISGWVRVGGCQSREPLFYANIAANGVKQKKLSIVYTIDRCAV